jgi:four helix bundle protein
MDRCGGMPARVERQGMFPFERLLVWQPSHRFAVDLHAQPRRATRSVAANVAEGAGSDSQGQFARDLSFAQASASEVRNRLRFAPDIGPIPPEARSQQGEEMQEVRKMLHVLR